ncbi:oligopeptide transport system substrate-binding protein [Breznakia sp. PF5-3]|uniref:peptide ABC transporter substrate-binding protein n=1 Tax=unclassified Breznakia TaxID=2623764 RepID=UPI0024053941|nr:MULTISPECIES: peptide ABC transporter substrate-binding protein [unclassified Breznakia]MDF9824594.1 oligopeptide transport system substrate-binding protein [Breznakia sp. PM6-1]MDF9835484.1 oligopeptide transport system substrate-binding protein [Breznakia sp. PF5-3]MDF9837894.1 oligopeptide transport system substrate-binding protein [Breznakia sp. PFB2-8]MDF9859813.1 oligopeptide transport system substrate-binding protein [Breznakia sp. PH5-24]
MKKLFSVLGCFLLAATVLTGCGGGGDDKETKAKTELNVAIGGDAEFLDPAVVDDSITANILNQMYDGLYTLDQEGNAVPDLAEAEPEISEDGLTYTIKLKEGIKWSDGEELKASDFIYAWKRAVAIGAAEAYYSTFISDNVANAEDGKAVADEDFGAKAIDDYTIEITLKKKTPYFTALMTNTVFYPVREDFIKDGKFDELESKWADEAKFPTNGAFYASKINSKSKVTLSKNKEYYEADDVKLKKINFIVMADTDAQTNGFKSGEIDFATQVNNETVQADADLGEKVYLIDPYVINYFVLFNAGEENTVPELKDPEIRLAISQAIDREEVLDVFGYGDYSYELKGLVPKGIPGVDGDFREEADKEEEYSGSDLENAKKIMEKKGFNKDNRLKLSYKYNDLPQHKDVAQALQASLKDAYIDLELIGSEKEVFFTERDKGDFELARHAMSADFIDPMAYLDMYNGFTKAGNTVDDAEYEKLLAEANAEDDADKRLEKLHAAEKYLVKDMNYVVPLLGYSDPILKASNLEGVFSSPEGHYNLTRAEFK